MNAVGTAGNVETLLHEGGHAFHVFEFTDLPYVQQMTIPHEFAEVASMSMELLSAPYLVSGQPPTAVSTQSRRRRAAGSSTWRVLFFSGPIWQ